LSYEKESLVEKRDQLKPKFDPDLSPSHPDNQKAAEVRGLSFDVKKQAYVDDDGCLIRDRFGQPF